MTNRSVRWRWLAEGAKAGSSAPPLVLRLGSPDRSIDPAGRQFQHFADLVDDLSDGTIRLEATWRFGADKPDWEQQVIRATRRGDVDLALVASRAWDTEGVQTLRALNTPFLIDNDALVDRVVTDLGDDLMAGLDGVGVTGLALLPEAMRHPFGFHAPLGGPADYRDQVIRTPLSATTTAMFAAFGAHTTTADMDAATQVGMESEYQAEPGGTATGNVTFYPRVNVLAANARRWNALDEEQRTVLTRAAAETRDWVLKTFPNDQDAAAAFCAHGQDVVLAPAAQVKALIAAARPVVAEISHDPETADLVGDIRRLKGGTTPPAAPRGCNGRDTDGVEAPSKASRVLDGVYRFEITDDELLKAGVTPADLPEEHGVFTWTLDAGHWCWEQKARNVLFNPDDCGSYTLDRDTIAFRFPDGVTDTFHWTKLDDGSLQLRKIHQLYPTPAWVHDIWTRIGDVP